MSRRRNAKDREPIRKIVVVCTGGGTHREMVLDTIAVRVGTQRRHGQSRNPDGSYATVSPPVSSMNAPAGDADGFVKGVRIRCRDRSCAIDVVLKSTTILAALPAREDVWTSTVDVSADARLTEQ
ncbi:MAG: hypothetical protein JJT89_00545 [Nitriliruptoraceae bacterium]|nr:hypothetical protein [Nitriliruptoraceae bacterium]